MKSSRSLGFQLGHFKQARDHYLTLKNTYVARFGERYSATLFALDTCRPRRARRGSVSPRRQSRLLEPRQPVSTRSARRRHTRTSTR